MNPPKAIEILSKFLNLDHQVTLEDLLKAIALGNEALKLYHKQKTEGWHHPDYLLPGETKESNNDRP